MVDLIWIDPNNYNNRFSASTYVSAIQYLHLRGEEKFWRSMDLSFLHALAQART
jgi:hypothetical protein